MNRILIDNIENKLIDETKKEIIVNLNENSNIFIKNTMYTYIININNAKVNILFEAKNKENLNIKLNIKKSNVIFNFISFVGINQNIKINIYDESSIISFYNSQITKNKINIDILVNHYSNNTSSNINNFVVTKEDGNAEIKVVSKVEKGYKNCIINQDNKIIAFNNINKNKIEPILLIDEFDVKASHSAFIGKFNEEYLFYLMSRGLNKKQANDILLNAFLIGKLVISLDEKENLMCRR